MTETILIVGGTRGVGRAMALGAVAAGHRVVVVARGAEGLAALKAEAPGVETVQADAAADGVAAKLLAEHAPDRVVLVGGLKPHIAPISQHSWETFSAPWQADTKIAFEFTQAALKGGMKDGGTVVSFASGAALNGSPLSGGYAGAKRMQHLIGQYAQGEANGRDLGLKFYTIYPKQLIEGTDIGAEASSAYGKATGKGAEGFMAQWEAPLTPEKIAGQVDMILADAETNTPGAYGLTGTGYEPMG